MYLKPSNVYFSQDSINNVFDKRCNHSYKPIGETLDEICEGRCSVNNIPTISVVLMNGKWVTADNRRLWVFRQLERLGKCDNVFVQKGYYIPESKLTSENGGLTVHVRGSPGGYWHRKSSATKQRTNISLRSGHSDISGLSSSGISSHKAIANTCQISGYSSNVRPASGSRSNDFNVQIHSGDHRGFNSYGRTTCPQYSKPIESSPQLIPVQPDQMEFNSYRTTIGRPYIKQNESSSRSITDQHNKGRLNSYGTNIDEKFNKHNERSSRPITEQPDQWGLNSYSTTTSPQFNKQNGDSSRSIPEQRVYRHKTYDKSSSPNGKGILRNSEASDIMYTGKDNGCCIIL